jgi:hypothetical protein
MDFLSYYMMSQMKVTNLTKEDISQLIKVLAEGREWLNKPMPIPPGSLEEKRKEEIKASLSNKNFKFAVGDYVATERDGIHKVKKRDYNKREGITYLLENGLWYFEYTLKISDTTSNSKSFIKEAMEKLEKKVKDESQGIAQVQNTNIDRAVCGDKSVGKGWLEMIEENKEQFDQAIEDNIKKENARRYNSGKRQWSLLHYPSLEEAIKVLEFGAFKYSIFKEKVTGKTISGKELLEQHSLNIMGSKAMGNYELISSGKDNWKNGLDMTEMKESAQRHLVAMMNGELRDKESGCLHSAHLMVNGMFINYYELQN